MPVQDKIKILIIDDEKQFTEELNGLFVWSDYESFEANTVDEGRSILRLHDIDILILDVRLPGMDGLDLLKEIKALYPLTEVVVISAHGDMDTVIKAMRLGAFDYLRKPFRFFRCSVNLRRWKRRTP
jgi:DNA-binding NtrC family response regulator